jgi:ADP-ribosylglycohydrolase
MLGSGGAGGAGPLPAGLLDRAQGCLLGQLAGDSLGSLVEFKDAGTIRALFPAGVRDLADGGTWDTLAGQPTDDSEMALMLARSVIRAGRYEQAEAAVAYARWFASPPFDCGRTTAKALSPAAQALARGEAPAAVAAVAASAADPSSQANGALMRVSPLGVFGHAAPAVAAEWARQDAVLTHPHPVCSAANAAFIAAIATAVSRGADAEAVHSAASTMAAGPAGHPAVEECLSRAARRPPDDYSHRQGWVLTALGNAFWQLLHSKTLEEGVCDTVMRGGDADTNAAIAGALLGAVHGASAVPARWRDRLLACRPERGRPGVRRPRPRAFWPVDCLLVAERLVELGRDVDPKK